MESSDEDHYQINRLALFKAMIALGIDGVQINFDGSGDSGQIYGMYVYHTQGTKDERLNQKLDPPLTFVKRGTEFKDGAYVDVIKDVPYATLADAIEAICYELLDQDNSGWEINDGSYGEFEIDALKQSITLNMNEREMTSHFREYEY